MITEAYYRPLIIGPFCVLKIVSSLYPYDQIMNKITPLKPARRFTQMDPNGPKWRPKWTNSDFE